MPNLLMFNRTGYVRYKLFIQVIKLLFFFVVIISSFIFVLDVRAQASRANCGPNECTGDFYTCNNGNMCCRKWEGCPSYECDTDPGQTCHSAPSSDGSRYTCYCRQRTCTYNQFITRRSWERVCEDEFYTYWDSCCYTRQERGDCIQSVYRCTSTCRRSVQRCVWNYCWYETEYYPCNCGTECVAWRTYNRCIGCTKRGFREVCGWQIVEYRDPVCSDDGVPGKCCIIEESVETYNARGECFYCSGGSGGGGGGGPTCSSNPTAPTLNSPVNGSTLTKHDNLDVTFDWNAPTSWGANCTGEHTYRLLVDDENTFTNPRVFNETTVESVTDRLVSLPSVSTFYWRVLACNTVGCGISNTNSFSISCGSAPAAVDNPTPPDGDTEVVMPVTLRWDVTSDWGNACLSLNNNTYRVFAKVKNNPTCENPGSSYSEICSGSAASCSDSLLNVRNTSFCWYVETSNGTYSTPSATTGSEVWEFTTEDPIGFQNWITVLGGDFYSGDYSAELPNASAQVAPWSPVHTVYEVGGIPVSMITSNITNFTHDNTAGGYTPQSESGLYATSANYSTTWPPNYEGTPPSSAVELPLGSDSCSQIFTGSNKLEPFEVYEVDVACIEDAINAVEGFSNGYELDSEGYAVIFVTGSGDLDITGEFTTDNDDYRVVFVTGSDIDINIARSISVAADPDLTSEAQIEAAFIVTGSMEFTGVSTEPAGDPLLDPDTTIVVEGPIVAKNISFDRNLGRNNQFPSEIVKYNPNYIYNLTEEERTSLKSNGSGLFVIDVDWLKEE